jgi:hypothetical protein
MKKIILSAFIVFVSANQVLSQDAEPLLFAAYEHHVKPSMTGKYWECMKAVKDNSTQHKINTNWTSLEVDDNSFVHFMPIKNFAELDKNAFGELVTKMGDAAYSTMWSNFDACLDHESSYIVTYYPALSFKLPAEGENYRDILFWDVMQGKEKEAENLLKEWAKLYEAKKVPIGFQTFKITFGAQPSYVIVSWGKDDADHAMRMKKTRELLGEDMGKMWNKTMAITDKYYSKRGNILQTVSYSVAAAAGK